MKKVYVYCSLSLSGIRVPLIGVYIDYRKMLITYIDENGDRNFDNEKLAIGHAIMWFENRR